MGDFNTVILYTLSTNWNGALYDLSVPVCKVYNIPQELPLEVQWYIYLGKAERMQIVIFASRAVVKPVPLQRVCVL